MCDALSDFVGRTPDVCVNRHTGLHITLATHLNTEKRRKGFAARVTRLEPGLYTLVAPSRLYDCYGNWKYDRRDRNHYCRPLREGDRSDWERPFDTLARRASRYCSVNLLKASNSMRLLEVRMHHGTTEYRKIIPWIALWMQIFNRSRYSWEGEPQFGRVMPKGNSRVAWWQVEREDIFMLLREEGIFLPRAFEQLLRNRRKEMRASWNRAVPQRVSKWVDVGWYSDESPATQSAP